jgi:hypothetical protein
MKRVVMYQHTSRPFSWIYFVAEDGYAADGYEPPWLFGYVPFSLSWDRYSTLWMLFPLNLVTGALLAVSKLCEWLVYRPMRKLLRNGNRHDYFSPEKPIRSWLTPGYEK